jgi:tetratricopeptide (TPR) repeat protein
MTWHTLLLLGLSAEFAAPAAGRSALLRHAGNINVPWMRSEHKVKVKAPADQASRSALSCCRVLCCPCCHSAHYSAGQIYALQGQWPQSEASFKACAQLSTEPSAQAQALYCGGVALNQQGSYAAAMEAYEAASAAGPADNLRPMLALGTARALKQLGDDVGAAEVAGQALRSEWGRLCAPPVAQALKDLAGGSGNAAENAAGQGGHSR